MPASLEEEYPVAIHKEACSLPQPEGAPLHLPVGGDAGPVVHSLLTSMAFRAALGYARGRLLPGGI